VKQIALSLYFLRITCIHQ